MADRPCEACDFIGPEFPGLIADSRTFHRALHDLGREVSRWFEPIVARLARRLA